MLNKTLYKWRQSLYKCLYSRKGYESLRSIPGVQIDPDFYESLANENFQYRLAVVKKLPLISLRAMVYNGERFCSTAIVNSPCYRYLAGDAEAYIGYCEMINQRAVSPNDDAGYSLERFQSLIDSINAKGYRSAYTIVVNGYLKIKDGQHRACYLYHKYGPQHMVDVLMLW